MDRFECLALSVVLPCQYIRMLFVPFYAEYTIFIPSSQMINNEQSLIHSLARLLTPLLTRSLIYLFIRMYLSIYLFIVYLFVFARAFLSSHCDVAACYVDAIIKTLRARADLILFVAHIAVNKTNLCMHFYWTPCTITTADTYIMLNGFSQLVIPWISHRKTTKEMNFRFAKFSGGSKKKKKTTTVTAEKKDTMNNMHDVCQTALILFSPTSEVILCNSVHKISQEKRQ